MIPVAAEVEPLVEVQLLAEIDFNPLQDRLLAIEERIDVVLGLDQTDFDRIPEVLVEEADRCAVRGTEVPFPASVVVGQLRLLEKYITPVEVRVLRIPQGGTGDLEETGAVDCLRIGNPNLQVIDELPGEGSGRQQILKDLTHLVDRSRKGVASESIGIKLGFLPA